MTRVPHHLKSLGRRSPEVHIYHRLQMAIAKSNRDLMRSLAQQGSK